MTAQQVNNVTKLNQNRVYNHISSFIRDKANSSENTALGYETDIRQFFKFFKGKDIEQIEETDLKLIHSDILDYRTFLKELNYKNTTINRKINTVRSLYNFLKGNDYDVNPFATKVKVLPDDSERIGFLSPDEAIFLSELALTERQNGIQKQALILLAASTSMRKSAILNLKFSDISASLDDENKYIIYSPEILDKGKKVDKEIHKDLYDIIISFKGDRQDDDKIFTIDNKGISQMMMRLCKKADFNPKRNISFHSLKKAGVDYAYKRSGGDIVAATAQGGWTNTQTCFRHYIEPQKNIAGMGMFENRSSELFDDMGREELLELIKTQKKAITDSLINDAAKIINKRSS